MDEDSDLQVGRDPSLTLDMDNEHRTQEVMMSLVLDAFAGSWGITSISDCSVRLEAHYQLNPSTPTATTWACGTLPRS